MQLEQQENFTIHGPQLGNPRRGTRAKLPVPAQKARHSVDCTRRTGAGVGAGHRRGKAEGRVQGNGGNLHLRAGRVRPQHSRGNFEAQADAAANLIKQAGYVDSTPAAALQEAEDALATWNDTDDSPAVQYAANRRLYNAVDTLYASLNNKVDDSTQRALDDQYNAFVSAQATIERAANVYNLWVEDYEKTVSQFPANLISGLWGAQAPERFATK